MSIQYIYIQFNSIQFICCFCISINWSILLLLLGDVVVVVSIDRSIDNTIVMSCQFNIYIYIRLNSIQFDSLWFNWIQSNSYNRHANSIYIYIYNSIQFNSIQYDMSIEAIRYNTIQHGTIDRQVNSIYIFIHIYDSIQFN